MGVRWTGSLPLRRNTTDHGLAGMLSNAGSGVRKAGNSSERSQVSKERATALTDPELVDQLCDLFMSKLAKRLEEQLPSKQWVPGSSPGRDATKLF